MGHFDKHFVKKTKKSPQVKILEFYLLYALKTTFCMENLTQRWTQSGHIFSKTKARFPNFQNKTAETCASPNILRINSGKHSGK